jgi:hypothetical protein
MERAARRIEYAQGWQTESNTWSEINERGELVRKPYSHENAVPQKVQDMENLTGEQSAIRKAQNALKDKLKGLSTWEDFYNLLSLKGMKYQKKGSGAIISIDGVTVKASDVSRNLTLGKLEKQLGPFQEIHHLAQYIYDDKSKGEKIPQPLDDANRDNANWSAYISAKAEHYGDTKKRRERLYMTQQGERKELRDSQKIERQALSESYGKGISRRELNRQRSILATQHAYGRAVLKERHQKERETLRKQSTTFMSYEQWLRHLSLTEEAEKWRHRKNKRILLLERPDDATDKEPREYSGLSGLSMTVTRQGVKFASQDNPETVAFIDAGRVIKVYNQEGSSLLAALQLAQAKWGGVKINGTGEYKRKCAEIATRNGIKVSNPELQELMKELKQKRDDQPAISEAKPTGYSVFTLAKTLAQKELREDIIIAISAMDSREYHGALLGIVSSGGKYAAVQAISDNQVVLHDVGESDVPGLEALNGRELVMTSENYRLNAVEDATTIKALRRNRERGWSR